MKSMAQDPAPMLAGHLLEERLLLYRSTDTGQRTAATLPELFVALTQDAVRDFPALRPHQRHPWHAFLVQLAAISMHRKNQTEPFSSAAEWRTALLDLTPDDPDGAAWCLVSPVTRPAFMQAPEPSGSIIEWKNIFTAADELDMLVTSKNHDLKASRMKGGTPQDWIFALVSLQTQEGFLGAGNYGISRMNGGFANRCGVGIHPTGKWGRRWMRDLRALHTFRSTNAELFDLDRTDAHALVWTVPWDGNHSLKFSSLDPWYIEICRRMRLTHTVDGKVQAHATGSTVARIAAKALNGVTGDPWMPIDMAAGKALTIGVRGFDYKLAKDLLFGQDFTKPAAQMWLTSDEAEGVFLITQGVARGKGKTEGYHERRIPLSRKMRQGLLTRQTDELAKLANERIEAIAELRKMLWVGLAVLFGNGTKDEDGKDKDASDAVKERANLFAQPFEAYCDANFFSQLIEEIEANPADRGAIRQKWLLTLAGHAEGVLQSAFVAGPRNGQLRYRAQSSALNRLHRAMRSSKLPALAHALKSRNTQATKESHESV